MANNLPVPDAAAIKVDDAVAGLHGVRSRQSDHQNASPLRVFTASNADAPNTQPGNANKPTASVQAPKRLTSIGLPHP
jgi:hypothetical protein